MKQSSAYTDDNFKLYIQNSKCRHHKMTALMRLQENKNKITAMEVPHFNYTTSYVISALTTSVTAFCTIIYKFVIIL
jgi:flagellar biosynthesis protein FliP